MSDEPYGMILESFWTDPHLKRRAPPEGKYLLGYYFSSPHKNISGIYYCPISYVTDETGLSTERVLELLALPAIAEHVTFDPDTDEIFVHGLAKRSVGGRELKPKDTKRTALVRRLNAVHSPRLLRAFLGRYSRWGLDVTPPPPHDTPLRRASDGVSDTPSHTRAVAVPEQEQNSSDAKASGAPSGASAVDNPSERGKHPRPAKPLGQIAGAIRKIWWAPGGASPGRWTMDRELNIWQGFLDAGRSLEDCLGVIEGASWLQAAGSTYWRAEPIPLTWLQGEPLTARIFNRTDAGDLWEYALTAHRHGPPTPAKPAPRAHGKPIRIGEMVRGPPAR